MKPFIGRRDELRKLALLKKKGVASFVVLRGRRRIGKSRLILEFGRSMPGYLFSGIPPQKQTSRQGQLETFAGQMSRRFSLPPLKFQDWGEAFYYLGQQLTQGPALLALDEISWIGSKDPDFLGHLKNAWDLYFSKNPELILIVCGSISSWIDRNILSHTGFLGRISLDLHLKELSLEEASLFWNAHTDKIGPYERFKVLSVTGGVPRYLEEIQPALAAEENIRQLCFDESGLLYREFESIFSDLFSDRAPHYVTVVELLAGGSKSLEELAKQAKRSRSLISTYLQDLIHAGFVTADPTWNIASMKSSRLRVYRLSDNYLRFYLKYIAPNRERIVAGTFSPDSLATLPQWETTMGLQFENLVLRNVRSLCQPLHLPFTSITRFGPYFQRPTARHQGCQIDLLVQSKYRVLYLCEVKFSIDKIGIKVAREAEEKRGRLSLPRGWSYRMVLIHVNGVTGELLGDGTFDHIIDFGELLSG
ncbi:MAG: ATP-binding protein [Parachlamydiales bacterium]